MRPRQRDVSRVRPDDGGGQRVDGDDDGVDDDDDDDAVARVELRADRHHAMAVRDVHHHAGVRGRVRGHRVRGGGVGD